MYLHCRRRFRGARHYTAETTWGIFSNLWPTRESAADRAAGVLYCNVHAFGYVVEWVHVRQGA